MLQYLQFVFLKVNVEHVEKMLLTRLQRYLKYCIVSNEPVVLGPNFSVIFEYHR